MDPIQLALDNILEKNLEAMRENFSTALSQKAAETLEERKKAVAAEYFEKK